MDYRIDSGWQLYPIGGNTGSAYMGTREDEKVFLKRNSSPFLPALSVEGITPRLIWTKRVGNGDTLTAQEWLNGRELSADEMLSEEVIKILNRIHNSDNLLNMLKKVKGEIYRPAHFLKMYLTDLADELATNSVLNEVVAYLESTAEKLGDFSLRVCHGDVNRQNFLRATNGRLYLIDWEMVKIADPMSDITMLLTHYVEEEEWENWLKCNGIPLTNENIKRIEWYSLINCLLLIKQYHQTSRKNEMNSKILLLKKIFSKRIMQDS